MTNKKILIAAISAAFACGGCSMTEAYTAASTANDIGLETAVVKFCSPISTIAAERNWTKDELTARDLFCAERLKVGVRQ